ncbi:uncharacterized protein LOC126973914 [Leptidea sinapis]|uniref:uncharacterized protein LOC126973914 n=1 Tax=Leptidea sinapis TaxID=189913 RepID=UPI0021C29B90|nr:uncharacterized protein LOC126973914 [Leptidea sinapis]
MDNNSRKRRTYVSVRQKKKLLELLTKNPGLISRKTSQTTGFNSIKDSQSLWVNIANECNAIPGARKTWRQWRKTWQDLRSKTKKRHQDSNGELPRHNLTVPEKEVLGINPLSDGLKHEEASSEFISLNDNMEDSFSERSEQSINETHSPIEPKVFEINPSKSKTKNKSSYFAGSTFNCELLAEQEQRKIKIKEDYLNFKKDYLRQKLKLLREQTDALKSIAHELSK